MECCQGRARLGAMACAWAAEGKSIEECQKRGRAFFQYCELRAIPGAQRLGAGNPLPGEMFQETEEKWQIVHADALFVQREDEGPTIRLEKKIGILDPFGYALEASGRAEVIGSQHPTELVETDISIDGHNRSGS